MITYGIKNWKIYNARIYKKSEYEDVDIIELQTNFDYKRIQTLYSNLSSLNIGKLTNAYATMEGDSDYSGNYRDTILLGTSGELILTDFKYFFVLKLVSFFENAPAPKEMTK